MSNKYKFISLLFIVVFALFSCSKEGLQGNDGLQGPVGPVGPAGPTGATGAVGPAGNDGSIIYSGTGTPSPSVGKNGDYYFDKTFEALYGPKTNAGWGNRTILMGQQGATGGKGADGATILSGNGAPAQSLGKVGDFYLDKDTYLFYGPKTASTWGTRVLLKGADGAQGPVGPAGADGSTIYSGNGAPDAAIGDVGDYYIDKTNGNLYGAKRQSGWGTPTSLAGPQGLPGKDGSTILSGSGAPAAGLGNNGDFYLDKDTYLFYGPKTADGWGTGTSLKTASGGGASVTAFETADDTFLFWGVKPGSGTSGAPTSFVLREQKANGDTAGIFKLPDSLANTVNNGVVLVYLHTTNVDQGVNQWIQLSYTNVTAVDNQQVYAYTAMVNADGVFIKVTCDVINTGARGSSKFNIDKLRVVVIPNGTAGTLSLKRPSLPQLMQQFHLSNHSFKTVK